MAAPMENVVELGFVDKCQSFLLRSRFFPSKVGGKPAWLSLNPLPKPEELACRLCSKPTLFLMQIYAPNLEQNEAFHRTIFLFVCKNPECCKANSADNFYVLRSQLSRNNDFYSSEPPEQRTVETEIDATLYNKLCCVCGGLGTKTCGKCHNVNYCSKDHQTIDWKSGHKKICSSGETMEVQHGFLFPEMELETEEEQIEDEKEEKSDKDKLEEYAEYLKSNQDTNVEELSDADLEKMASKESANERQLRRFKKRISHEPEQVLRYNKGGAPLWISHEPVPAEIPDCPCGAKRQFEFQILPQLLTHLNVDMLGASLDWGTLCVYTCTASCSTGNQYSPEYIFKQDIS